MKKLFGIIKINILSLIALPLLLLAVAAKLLAKALEKTVVAIGSIVIFLAAMLIAAVIQNPGEMINAVFVFIIVLIIGSIITAFIVFLFTIASGIIMAAVAIVIGILDVIYELFYGAYSALYHKCKQCYEEQLSGMENRALKGFLCLVYSILLHTPRELFKDENEYDIRSSSYLVGCLVLLSRYVFFNYGIFTSDANKASVTQRVSCTSTHQFHLHGYVLP